MPHTNKPSTTKIQDMFNDILTIKEKTTKFSSPFSTQPTNSTERNSSDEETKAVNGNLITDASHACQNREISLISSSGDLQLNGRMKLPSVFQDLTSCNISLSAHPISDSRRNDPRSKLNSDSNLLSGHNTQPTLHSNSCSDVSSETEDYFDQESISTASLSCSPFLPKKIVSLNSAASESQNTPVSSADECAIVSDASDLETFETTPTSITKDEKWDELASSLPPIKVEKGTSKTKSEEDTALIAEQVAATEFLSPTTATTISSWLSRVQSHGFPADVLQTYINDEMSYEEDETWWDPNVVRIFDPYYDISPEDIESITEGKKNAAGDPVGQCVLQLSTGDEVYGNFRKGVRQGRGSISGSNMEKHGVTCIRGYYRDGVLMGEGRAILSGGKPLVADKIGSNDDITANASPTLPYPYPYFKGQIALEGIFNDGYLEGPVRGTDEKGQLVFIGMYSKGLPIGNCWQAMEGQGWIYGQVDTETGQFTGDNIAYIYPDLLTCLVGKFEQGRLIEGRPSCIVEACYGSLNDYFTERNVFCSDMKPIITLQIMNPEDYSSRLVNVVTSVLSTKIDANSLNVDSSCNEINEDEEPDEALESNPLLAYTDSRLYSHCPSNSVNVPCDWTLRDPYERVTVTCRVSSLPTGAGDGLFALRDIPEKTIISYYNGIRLFPGESYTTTSCNYQIYVDWSNTDESPYIDIPKECVDATSYCASLAHKANHGFKPNCRYVPADHPRFGRVPALETLVDVHKGDELFSHYKYDAALAPNWYQEAWNRFTHPEEYNDEDE